MLDNFGRNIGVYGSGIKNSKKSKSKSDKDKRNITDNSVHQLSLNALFFITIFLIFMQYGCSSKSRLIYISVPCDIELPIYPIKQENISRSIIEILKYTELLEASLDACRDKVYR